MVAGLVAVAGLLACTEVKIVNEGRDAGGESPPEDEPASLDGGTDGARKDAGKTTDAGGDAGFPPCDGPCPTELLASGIAQATTITVDDANVYFGNEGGTARVSQCPKSGCTGAPLVLGDGYAFGIASIGGQVYWGDFETGKVWKCAAGGCGQTPTAIAVNQSSLRGVFTDGVDLYWSAGNDIVKCTPTSCTPTTVRAGVGAVYDLAADQGKLFYIASSKAWMCPVASCTNPVALGNGAAAATGITVRGSTAYWVSASDTIVAADITMPAVPAQTVGTSSSPEQPLVDGQHLYFRDGISADILRCPISGCAGGNEIFAEDQRGQSGANLAADGAYVYWTAGSKVLRVHK